MGLDYGKSTGVGENKVTETKENNVKEVETTPKEQKTLESAEPSTTEKEKEEVVEEKEEKEKEKEEGDNLKKFYDGNPDKKSLKGKGNFKLEEGDYEEKSDGKIVIRKKHFMDDITSMVENPQKFFNIRKSNPEKAKLFTKWMGITHSDGSPDTDKMASVLNEFLIAKTPEDERKIIDDNFPEWLAEGKLPFLFEEKESKKEEKETSKEIPYRQGELDGAIESFVKNYSKTKTEKQPNITSEEVSESVKFYKALKENTHNPAGGKLRTPSEIVKIAFEKAFNTKEVKETVTQGGRGSSQKPTVTAIKGPKKRGPQSWYQ